MLPLILVLVAITLIACSYDNSNIGITDFTATDPLLIKGILDAAQEWTDKGIVVAAKITVNINPKGIPVNFTPRETLPKLCNVPLDKNPGACSTFNKKGVHNAIWIPDDEKNRPDRLRIKILHELIHTIIPLDNHLSPGVNGIMTGTGETDGTITQADLDLICSHTQCV